MPFVPGQLAKARSLEPMYEDVPPHLSHQLWSWVAPWLNPSQPDGVGRIRAVANHLRWPYSEAQQSQYGSPDAHMRQHIETRCKREPEVQLQVVEFLLATSNNQSAAQSLEAILRLGNSAYAVNKNHDGLVMRLDPTIRAQVERVVAQADDGPSHWIAEAYNDAYGRDPRPGPSYDASIRAVEGALRDIVIPKNSRATITQIINALRDGRGSFEFELEDARGAAIGANEPKIDGTDAVLAMLRSLAYGQRTRHGEAGTVTVNSAQEARAAFQLAVALVQIGTSRALRRNG